MRYTATVTFTAKNGKQGRRQFMVDTAVDGNAVEYAYRAGMAAAAAVGGYGVHVVGLRAW
ncbi:hypothetical protein [Synechococcus phage S-N03]|uniref:Uncharacterized protein n=2 Tax=Kyanoviridae TaxID=2946160 RepID=A0A6G8R6F1_9CAUD|nr:hypothetical protein PQC09_gp035 [Synechococcus phage S-N03]YP_010670623.1 hypothetical protein PQC15_gp084 [Synechococcus phage S-H34]QIN96670.1 hypothetical protein [Synechococcus phage S-N03]QIN96955.1 hypothetical protein [Synechococcus phage S-H34]